MKEETEEYDFVIIGSGLGGLECGYILASEGYSVVILEKNHQVGGNLQVFSRDKSIFDTGVHYVGSLNEGENLHQFFKYFRLMDKLKLRKLDEDGFDVIKLKDGKEYRYGQGYDNFKKIMCEYFPDERRAIYEYCDKIQSICKKFPLYNMEAEAPEDYINQVQLLEESAFSYIQSITNNKDLQNVLAGSNPLYAGIRDKTPFYVHALIINSYLTGSYRFVDGGAQIAILLSRYIRAYGGKILKHKHVVSANYNDDNTIKEVVLANGETVKGKNFISNVHPAITIDIFGENRFLKVYSRRVKSLENSLSTFVVHLSFHKDTFEYINHNIYRYYTDDVWEGPDCGLEGWPQGFFISVPPVSKSEKYADAMSVMCYMKYEDMEKWKKTFNTIAEPGDRGDDYEAFKKMCEQKVLEKLEEEFPDIRSKIKGVYSSTPLSFRDFIGTEDGSMYGIVKDCNSFIKTHINTKTKIPNLALTGQNIGLHGVLGVTITAFLTCFNFVDRETLMSKVKSA